MGPVQAQGLALASQTLPLDPTEPARNRVGELTYAGGLRLTAPGSTLFGGVSGIDVGEGGAFIAQEDVGEVVRGRLTLDAAGRLMGVEGATIQAAVDEHGFRYLRKEQQDAEDVTLTPNGYAISFEQDHRILVYPPSGLSAVQQAVAPALFRRPDNAGLEALAWKDGRFYEGAEDGKIWRCEPAPATRADACRPVMATTPFQGFKLTGLDAAGRGFVAVYRALDPLHGWRAVIAWLEPADALGSGPWRARRLAVLERPLTRDNMEGIAAVSKPGGGFRLYLVSDDNFYPFQRTLLLAFDWAGPPPAPGAPTPAR